MPGADRPWKPITPLVAKARLERLVGLGPENRRKAQRLIEALGDQTTVTVAVARDTVAPGASEGAKRKQIERLIRAVAEAAEDAGVDLALSITGAKSSGADGQEIGFVARTSHQSGAALPEYHQVLQDGTEINDRQGVVLDEHGRPRLEPRLSLEIGPRGKPLVRVFLSWARNDKQEARRLWELLTVMAANNAHYEFELWSFDQGILVGEDWDATIRSAMEQADIALFALSHHFLGSEYISTVELPRFVKATAKRAVPVLLKPLDFENTDLKGLDRKQIFRHPFDDERAFSRARDRREEWAEALIVALCAMLDRYSDVDGGSAGSPILTATSVPAPPAPVENEPVTRVAAPKSCGGRPGQAGHSRLDYHGLPYMIEVEGEQGRGLVRRRPEARSQEESGSAHQVPALDYLLEWACDGDAPLAALLGEYGMGKTITCQALTHRLEQRRTEGIDAPLVHYFDLRDLSILGGERVPTLTEILDECIERGWTSEDRRLPPADELLDEARSTPTVFVIDGLDEALVHLNQSQGRKFTAELLKLRPQRSAVDGSVYAPFAGEHTKLLISCRTHYFPTLHAQSTHFTQQNRGRAAEGDYVSLVLAPLNRNQIETYLSHVFSPDQAVSVMETFDAVHDLSGLTTRPFTLSQLVGYVPMLEERRQRGEPVYNSTIYEQMALDWLGRDGDKHQIDADHKLSLAAGLAAWMWQRQSRMVEAGRLHTWLHQQLGRPELAPRYRGADREKLEEDLRTASFLVRHDDETGSGFRFAHSSIQEFFLARALLDAVRGDRPEGWELPQPSDETLEFLGQLLEQAADRNELLATLGTWRTPYREGTSELLLRYGLFAHTKKWPTPSLAGIDLQGADLLHQRFVGEPGRILNLTGANLAGTTLTGSDWQWAELAGANLERACLDSATFDRVTAPGARLADADLTGAFIHNSDFDTAGAGRCEGLRVSPARRPTEGRFRHWEVPTNFAEGVTDGSFSPGGKWWVAAGLGTVRIYDTTTWDCTHTLTDHTNWVRGVAFNHDGTLLATTSADGAVRTTVIDGWEPVFVGHALGNGEHVSWTVPEQRLVDVSEQAWRRLRARVVDDNGHFLRLDPHELHTG